MSSNRLSESVPSNQWTILPLLQWAAGYFKSKDIDSPRSTAEVLLAHTLDTSRIELYLRYDQPLKKNELARFKQLIQRRIQHEPVAYITGKKEFWSLNLTVSPEVLIPRPETECLVEQVLNWISGAKTDKPGDLLDLGTGSGAIVLALAKELPNWRCCAVDQNDAAINIARQNAIANGLENAVSFWVSNWFDAVEDHRVFDLVVSNPPYISISDMEKLQPEIRLFEPRMALDGGEDGLQAIRQILFSAPSVLRAGGALLMEIGCDQADAVRELVRESGAYSRIDLFQDYSQQDRVVRIVAN